MRPKSDSVFLLTLVDLLVQIIFLAIFVGAIYVATDGKEDVEKKRISDPKAKIIVEVGILKVAEIVNTLTKLVPADRLMELVVLLPEFKSLETLKAALRLAEAAKFNPNIIDDQKKELEKKTTLGVGLPTCIIDSEKNNVLLRLQAQDEFYVVTRISTTAKEFFRKIDQGIEEGQRINYQQLELLGSYVVRTEKECRFSVQYEPTNDSFTSYKYVQQYFRAQFIPVASSKK